MLFPIRCYSCSAVIGGKYDPPPEFPPGYVQLVKAYRTYTKQTEMEYVSATTVKTAEGKALDDLGVDRMCCRRHFLSHVDLS